MPQKKEPLKDIRTSLLTRGFKLARAGIRAGGFAAGQLLNSSGDNKPAWLAKVEILVNEMGQLKGTAMKVGQTMSMYGEHLLPKEVNEIFKKLQQESPPVMWSTMRKTLERELGAERMAQLEVDPEPLASASIGQVHTAIRKDASGADEKLALKIQYEGIDAAVDTDLKLLKFILNMSEMVPRGPRFDQVFAEIRTMFKQEVDYDYEREAAAKFKEWLKDDPRYKVPFIDPKFSTKRVLTMERLNGVRADHPDVQALSQERRNRLGVLFLELYLRELLEFRLVQTDPHLGNYLIEIDPTGENDKLVLLDFGAVRDVPDDFLHHYRLLMEGGIGRDARKVEKGGRMLGLLLPEDPMELVKDYVDLCYLLTEPFQSVYDWGETDLPKRVAAAVGKIASSYRLRAPPRELVFLDRKLGGVFIFLSVLKCVMDAKPSVEKALAKNPATTS